MSQFRKPPSAPPRFSIAARLRSFTFAMRGLRLLVHREHNARVHLAATALAITAGLSLRLSIADWRWIMLAIGTVWLAEAFNTAIEELCDRVCPQVDAAIGRTKDLAAAAVLAASIMAALIGCLTFAPYVAPLLRQPFF